MDKLISLQSVITILENKRFEVGKDLAKNYLLADVQEQIERLPAAFDKEKVIEELGTELELADEEKKRCLHKNRLQFDEVKGYAQGIAYSIGIVEKGGI